MQGVDKIINGGHAVLFGDIGQVGIAGGCRGTGVAEDLLDMPETQTIFK